MGFEGRKQKVMDVIYKMMGKVEEFGREHESRQRHTPSVEESHWEPPPMGVVKVNSDAPIFPNARVGVGGVARDHKGDVWVATFCE